MNLGSEINCNDLTYNDISIAGVNSRRGAEDLVGLGTALGAGLRDVFLAALKRGPDEVGLRGGGDLGGGHSSGSRKRLRKNERRAGNGGQEREGVHDEGFF